MDYLLSGIHGCSTLCHCMAIQTATMGRHRFAIPCGIAGAPARHVSAGESVCVATLQSLCSVSPPIHPLRSPARILSTVRFTLLESFDGMGGVWPWLGLSLSALRSLCEIRAHDETSMGNRHRRQWWWAALARIWLQIQTIRYQQTLALCPFLPHA